MKISTKIVKILPIMLGISLLASCNDTPVPKPNPGPGPEVITPIEISDFAQVLNTNKNYTYTYEFSQKNKYTGEWETLYKYVDRFNEYGMYSECIIDQSEPQEIGYAQNEKDGAFKVTIDENGNVIPGRQVRKNIDLYYKDYSELVVAIDDLKFTDYELAPYKQDNMFSITNSLARNTILEASQINSEKITADFRLLTINLNNSKKVEINGDFGKNAKLVGTITEIGTTQLPEIESYIKAGKGPFIKTEIEPDLQEIVNKLNTFNYQTPLYGLVSNMSVDVIGTKYVYETSTVDKKAVAVLYDVDSAESQDFGYIEITENGGSQVYDFKVIDNKIAIQGETKVNATSIKKLDEIYVLPNMTRMLSEDIGWLDYNPTKGQELYYTTDIVCMFDMASYFNAYLGIPWNMKDGIKEYLACGVKLNKDLMNGDSISVHLNVIDGLGYNPLTANFYNFGKVKLDMVDQFMEAR